MLYASFRARLDTAANAIRYCPASQASLPPDVPALWTCEYLRERERQRERERNPHLIHSPNDIIELEPGRS